MLLLRKQDPLVHGGDLVKSSRSHTFISAVPPVGVNNIRIGADFLDKSNHSQQFSTRLVVPNRQTNQHPLTTIPMARTHVARRTIKRSSSDLQLISLVFNQAFRVRFALFLSPRADNTICARYILEGERGAACVLRWPKIKAVRGAVDSSGKDRATHSAATVVVGFRSDFCDFLLDNNRERG